MKIDVKTIDNKAAGDITLADAVFGVAPRADIVARVVKWQLAKRRAGTHKVKSRAEVAITTAKMFKQKALAAHVTVLPLLSSSVVVVLFMVRLS
jgi:large subunit ribosomal protein L4